jgi:hypothetical protein
MEDSKALGIVSALANGVNPLTGEVFAQGSPYQAPEIVRALHLAARALEASGRAQAPQRADVPGNVGKPWTREEDERLLAEYERGRTPAELARAHGRTVAGIEARLEKHGRLSPEQRTTSNRYPAGRDGQSGSPRGNGSSKVTAR